MIDTHVHLDDKKYNGQAADIIKNFDADGIDFVINNSCDMKSMQGGLQLAQQFDRVYCTVGMHPHDAKSFDAKFEKIMTENAQNPKVVAVGEIGLDYFYDFSDRQIQRDIFAHQIELADKFNLPIVLHIRDAFGDALDILQAQKKFLNNKILWHCFCGSAELARQVTRQGHYVALGGVITFKNARKSDVVESVPLDRILSETDCPYMTPEPNRGQLNYPKYVRFVVEKLAQIYDISAQKMEEQIKENCLNFFTKIKA